MCTIQGKAGFSYGDVQKTLYRTRSSVRISTISLFCRGQDVQPEKLRALLKGNLRIVLDLAGMVECEVQIRCASETGGRGAACRAPPKNSVCRCRKGAIARSREMLRPRKVRSRKGCGVHVSPQDYLLRLHVRSPMSLRSCKMQAFPAVTYRKGCTRLAFEHLHPALPHPGEGKNLRDGPWPLCSTGQPSFRTPIRKIYSPLPGGGGSRGGGSVRTSEMRVFCAVMYRRCRRIHAPGDDLRRR